MDRIVRLFIMNVALIGAMTCLYFMTQLFLDEQVLWLVIVRFVLLGLFALWGVAHMVFPMWNIYRKKVFYSLQTPSAIRLAESVRQSWDRKSLAILFTVLYLFAAFFVAVVEYQNGGGISSEVTRLIGMYLLCFLLSRVVWQEWCNQDALRCDDAYFFGMIELYPPFRHCGSFHAWREAQISGRSPFGGHPSFDKRHRPVSPFRQ